MAFKLHYFDTLPSTQLLAHERVAQGSQVHGDVILAAQQTAGYGRRGRAWQSLEGNFFATIILDLPDNSLLGWMGFATSLALYDATTKFLLPDQKLSLKWPNDLLLDGGKLAGILLEVVDRSLLVGIGVNLVHAPPSDQQTACLSCAVPPTPQQYLAILEPFFLYWHEKGMVEGFAGLRNTWLDRASLQQYQDITARLADGRILTGKFIDLNPHGALVLQTQDMVHTITAADIYTHSDQKKHEQTSPR